MSISNMKRSLCWSVAIGAALCGPVAAQATWPSKTVKFVVPSNAGGSPDRVTRLIAERLARKWKQPTIVENKAGATSIIGTDFVAKSAPDGYTLLSTFTSFVQVPALFKKVPYDTERDFTPVTQTVAVDVLFLVKADSPYKTLPDFAAAAKTAKPPLSYGSFGNGSSFHIYGEKLAKGLGVDLTHVPYKGELPSTSDLLGGQIDSAFASVGTALPFLKDGRLRALGVASGKRSKAVPDISTLAEQGVGLPDLMGWFGILAPAGTPEPVIQKVAADVHEILAQPDMVKILRDQGLEPVASTPQAFGARVRSDLTQWKRLLPEVGITPSD
ncbi:tripartite-type tricarboxylate transporter receptor subunit TctC [Variovorax boronicumulans]|jgi:tripartite-type tricarboxylate transporter receptor subunit TctC|uniref:Bug family tripartite tricarboxylate transporter substrate binding protein n=1 Tax=Variovorax boronicumulans TaxID=436515 RepID=UPI002786BEC4|nr:tripartite tricarboxylate transporter substrate-binding protein [Variovorax boronicumulans]MDQ0038639.1 tripartite-type tricarboxylate transporter receptor subunit TctC [Variovorax boronicumulans]